MALPIPRCLLLAGFQVPSALNRPRAKATLFWGACSKPLHTQTPIVSQLVLASPTCRSHKEWKPPWMGSGTPLPTCAFSRGPAGLLCQGPVLGLLSALLRDCVSARSLPSGEQPRSAGSGMSPQSRRGRDCGWTSPPVTPSEVPSAGIPEGTPDRWEPGAPSRISPVMNVFSFSSPFPIPGCVSWWDLSQIKAMCPPLVSALWGGGHTVLLPVQFSWWP